LALDLRCDGALDLRSIEAERSRLRDETLGGFGQFHLVRPRLAARSFRDERAAPALRSEDAFALEFEIGAVHRVRIDRQRDRDFAHRRQPIAAAKRAPRDRVQDLIAELKVNRDAGAFVQPKLGSLHCVGVLRHLDYIGVRRGLSSRAQYARFMETVAFYGAGMLGSAMIQAMLRRGVQVRVWNRSFERAQALEAHGAVAIADPAEAARGAAYVHLCLYDDASVDATLERALAGIEPSTPIVDHTTALPQRVLERCERLAHDGRLFFHAPVFMGPPMAREAKGTMLASGDAVLFERLRPALGAMCSDLRYLGSRADLAAVYKLLGNAMILAVVGGLSDVFRIAGERGLTREQAYELFSFYDPSGQIGGRGKRMAAGDYEPAWKLDVARKDALLMQAAANHERLPVIDAIEAMLRDASARGLGDRDLAAVAAV